MQLRPYQIEGKNKTKLKFKEGKRRVVVVGPTGSGKSAIFTDLAVEATKRGKTTLIIADRWELLKQARSHLKKNNVHPVMITPSWRGQESSCYVASIQTLRKRQMPHADLIILDEAHINAYSKVLENPLYTMSYILGFTATPRSTAKFDLSKFYEDMVEFASVKELIEDKWLVPAKYFGAWEDLGKLKMKGDEYDPDELFQKFNKRKMYDGMIDAYKLHTPGTKAICYCINVEHAEKTTQEFNDHGVKAVLVTGETDTSVRERNFREFESGDAMVLVNVDIATKGYDYPPTQTIIINRKTKSEPLYLQIIGRGSRPNPGKEFFNIIDMGSNLIEHGWYDNERYWSLYPKRKSSKKKGLAPIKTCGNDACGCLVPAISRVCKFCGFVFPIEVDTLVHSEGIVEIDKNRITQIPDHLVKKKFSQMSIEELEQVRSIKGYKLGWIIHQLNDRGDQALEEYRKLKGYKHGWDNHYKKRDDSIIPSV